MDRSASIKRVREFIRGIAEYYRQCHVQMSGPLTITRQMASFALPEVPGSELDACLRQLAEHGYIAILNKEQMSFTPIQA